MWLFSWKKPPKDLSAEVDELRKGNWASKVIFQHNKGSAYTNRQFAYNGIKTIRINNAKLGPNIIKADLIPDLIELQVKWPSLVYIINVFNLDSNQNDNEALDNLTYNGKIREFVFYFNKPGSFKITLGCFWNYGVKNVINR